MTTLLNPDDVRINHLYLGPGAGSNMEVVHLPTGLSVSEHVTADSAEARSVIQNRLLVTLETKVQHEGKCSSTNVPAQHYLKIYRFRLSMAERGVIRPHAEVVDFMRRLVAGLEMMDPQANVKLETGGGWTRFSVAATDALIAEIDFTPYHD